MVASKAAYSGLGRRSSLLSEADSGFADAGEDRPETVSVIGVPDRDRELDALNPA